MKEIIIEENEHNQRMDKFLKKYLPKASSGYIYKMLRKKRIKLNNKKAQPKDNLQKGDKLQLFLSTDTITGFREEKRIKTIPITFDVIYEDDNILLINKPKGLLSHASNNNSDNTVVKQLLSYLYQEGKYHPQKEKTFVPSICNRLDRNTSGIIICGKTFTSLQVMNQGIKKRKIKKLYKCIVKGKISNINNLEGYIVKNSDNNRVRISKDRIDDSKKIHTKIRPLKANQDYTLLEIDLITGRTHQIRAHLASIGYPIIGDEKYGDRKTNEYFKEKHKLKSQFLHAHKIVFEGLSEPLEYINGKEFSAKMESKLRRIEDKLFET